jgi:hypothetical protein
MGANVIVCVQKGAMPAGEFFRRELDVLGLRDECVIAGVPMEKARWSIDELRAFCATLPWYGARIHLLGLGPKSKRDAGQTLNRYWRAIEAIKAVRPNCLVTSDSALVPSISGRTNGRNNHPAEELGGPRIYTKLQDEARTKHGLRSSDAKFYGIQGEGFIEMERDRIRAEDAGWFDEELYDSVEEARAHRLSGFPPAVLVRDDDGTESWSYRVDLGNANVGNLPQANIQVAGQLALDFDFTKNLHHTATL